MSVPQRTAAALAASRSLQHGDFLECLVESSMRGIVEQLKVEYQRELGKALEAAGLERVEPWAAQEVSASDEEKPAAGGAPGPLREAACADKEQKGGSQSWDLADAAKPEPTVVSSPEPMVMKQLPQMPGMVGSATELPPNRRRGSINSAPGGRLTVTSDNDNTTGPLKTLHRASSDNRNLTLTMKTKKNHYALTEKEEETLRRLRGGRNDEAKPDTMFAYAQTKGRTSSSSRLMAFSAAGATMSRVWAFDIISRRKFDFIMGMVIVANAVTIGMETSLTVHGRDLPVALSVLEYLFLVIYAFELFLRFHAIGWRKALESSWVRFDASLVVVGIVNVCMVSASTSGSQANTVVGNINMLKLLRLVRLARTIRVLVQFRTLWLLCQGLIKATAPMAWTCLVMCIVVYVFAVIGMETIVGTTGNDQTSYLDAASNFDTMWTSMLSLMQLMFLDSSAAIYRPLIIGNPWLTLYFGAFTLIGPIALMGIVTAILVESSLRTANEDNEAKKAWESMKRKEMLPVLKNLFSTLDANSDGEVDLEELFACSAEVKEQIQRIIDLSDIEEIFHMLDVDDSGAISLEEFIDGIMRSQADKPSELIVLVRQGRAILEILRKDRKRESPIGSIGDWPGQGR